MGIRIGPIRLSSRGARISVGPRIARVHIGAGRTGFSSGVGPFGVSTVGPGRARRMQRQMQTALRPYPSAPPLTQNQKIGLLVFLNVAALSLLAAGLFALAL